MLRIVALCVLCLTVTTMAHAQDFDQIRSGIDLIRERLDDLEAHVSALETGPAIPPSDNTDTLVSSESSDGWVDDAFESSASTPEADPAIPPSVPPSSNAEPPLGWRANPADFAAAEAWLGRPIAYAEAKMAFGRHGFSHALNDTQKAKFEAWENNHPDAQLSLIVDLYPRSKSQGPEFASIANGDWDAELRQIARRLIDTGQEDAVLRLWHEPELSSRKWCDDPAYVPAWRRVHDLFMAEAGAAFEWQYSVNGPAGSQRRSADGSLWIDKCYPGAAYVDQVSVGMYDRQGATPDASWQKALAKVTFVRDWALARGHRFSIAEWGLWASDCHNPGHGENPSFIQNSYDFFAAIPEASRGYMLYFNTTDCSDLDLFPQSKAQFEELFGG